MGRIGKKEIFFYGLSLFRAVYTGIVIGRES